MLNILKDMDSTEELLFRLGGTLEIWESHIVIVVEILEGSGREWLVLGPAGKYWAFKGHTMWIGVTELAPD
jgi:hypothetical protein